MAGFTLTETINKTPEEVFHFACDLDNAPKWLKSVTRIEKITDGPLRVGTRFRETRMMGGREAEAEIEVTAHEPPRVHAATAAFPGGEATYTYTFTPKDGGTLVEMTADVRARGLMKLMAPMMVAMMKKQDGDQLTHLKTALEQGA